MVYKLKYVRYNAVNLMPCYNHVLFKYCLIACGETACESCCERTALWGIYCAAKEEKPEVDQTFMRTFSSFSSQFLYNLMKSIL